MLAVKQEQKTTCQIEIAKKYVKNLTLINDIVCKVSAFKFKFKPELVDNIQLKMIQYVSPGIVMPVIFADINFGKFYLSSNNKKQLWSSAPDEFEKVLTMLVSELTNSQIDYKVIRSWYSTHVLVYLVGSEEALITDSANGIIQTKLSLSARENLLYLGNK